jgi:hypothetical protein
MHSAKELIYAVEAASVLLADVKESGEVLDVIGLGPSSRVRRTHR